MMPHDALSEGSLGALFHRASAQAPGEGEIAWYAHRLPASGSVLDAMAGSGRLLVPLLDAGFNVHGAEASAKGLADCRARLDARHLATELFRQSAVTLNLPFRYTAAFIGGGAFQRLVDRADALDALLRIRAHLVEPARLLLYLFVPAGAEHPPGAAVVEVRTVTPIEGCRIGLRSETSFDVDSRRVDVIRRYERRDALAITAREDEMLSFTWYSEAEAAALLEAAGYQDIEVDPAPWPGDSERHFAVTARTRVE
jgi:hypothetical protein